MSLKKIKSWIIYSIALVVPGGLAGVLGYKAFKAVRKKNGVHLKEEGNDLEERSEITEVNGVRR